MEVSGQVTTSQRYWYLGAISCLEESVLNQVSKDKDATIRHVGCCREEDVLLRIVNYHRDVEVYHGCLHGCGENVYHEYYGNAN